MDLRSGMQLLAQVCMAQSLLAGRRAACTHTLLAIKMTNKSYVCSTDATVLDQHSLLFALSITCYCSNLCL